MKPSVAAIFPTFSIQFEGRVPWMYQDVKGLVTIGIGNLIDPISTALPLPFRRFSDKERATVAEIRNEWLTIKGRKELAMQGHTAARRYATLYLEDIDIDALVRMKMAQNETFLRKTFKNWDAFPADAQLGIMSMAWAMGAGFPSKFPSFTKSVLQLDWKGAAKNCLMRTTGNPGLVPRNHADVKLFNAAAVTSSPNELSK